MDAGLRRGMVFGLPLGAALWWALYETHLIVAFSLLVGSGLVITSAVGLEASQDRKTWAWAMLLGFAVLTPGVLAL